MELDVGRVEESQQDLIRRMRQMTPEERLMEAFRLSEIRIEAAKERVRSELPGATEDEVFREVNARFDEIHRAELLGFTVVIGRLKLRGDPPT